MHYTRTAVSVSKVESKSWDCGKNLSSHLSFLQCVPGHNFKIIQWIRIQKCHFHSVYVCLLLVTFQVEIASLFEKLPTQVWRGIFRTMLLYSQQSRIPTWQKVLRDDPRWSCSSTVTTDEMVHKAHDMVMSYRRLTTRCISVELGTSQERVKA